MAEQERALHELQVAGTEEVRRGSARSTQSNKSTGSERRDTRGAEELGCQRSRTGMATETGLAAMPSSSGQRIHRLELQQQRLGDIAWVVTWPRACGLIGDGGHGDSRFG
ncbi:hypothetical protein M0R45_001569 [Rubus argutus]|uniref:Uncharacterized protein n=1 Tax=Rubus argutus TaxID=59490 RepID=A0AAW1VMG5_RUBAR